MSCTYQQSADASRVAGTARGDLGAALTDLAKYPGRYCICSGSASGATDSPVDCVRFLKLGTTRNRVPNPL